MSTGPYTCPGLDLPQLPDAPGAGYVACYRAGHTCPPKEAIRDEREDGALSVKFRCPCCGDGGSSFFVPASMRDKREGGLS